jgi:hypothetical protein
MRICDVLHYVVHDRYVKSICRVRDGLGVTRREIAPIGHSSLPREGLRHLWLEYARQIERGDVSKTSILRIPHSLPTPPTAYVYNTLSIEDCWGYAAAKRIPEVAIIVVILTDRQVDILTAVVRVWHTCPEETGNGHKEVYANALARWFRGIWRGRRQRKETFKVVTGVQRPASRKLRSDYIAIGSAHPPLLSVLAAFLVPEPSDGVEGYLEPVCKRSI